MAAPVRLLVFKRCAKAPTESATASQSQRPKLLCRCCGGVMRIVRRRILPVITESPGARINGEGMPVR